MEVHLLAEGRIVGSKRELKTRCGETILLSMNEPLTRAPVTVWGGAVTCTACLCTRVIVIGYD